MVLSELVEVSDAVASTAARSAKVELLAGLLRRVGPDEVVAAVGFLTGEPRQGRVGVGAATLRDLEGVPPAPSPSLRLADLDAAVAAVGAATGPGSAAERRRVLSDLLSRATAEEQWFVRRLFAGELRQGALEGVMAEAVAKAAGVPSAAVRRAAMFSGDLARTAAVALSEGTSGLQAIGLEVLRPVLPMLASPADDVAEALGGTGPASVEWKLDGVRIQVHRAGDQVRIFTRNLNDVTARMPDVCEVVRGLAARTLVLDGEAILLGDGDRPLPFQETMSSVGRRAGSGAVRASFFDVLHAEGEDLVDLPLAERLERLALAVGDLRIPGRVTDDPAEAQRVFEDALAAGHEGVMVKALDSPYQAGRRGRAWRKVKPEVTLDLVVLGAEWGHGRRRGWLSNLHLGARDPSGGFVMVGKTFKGLTDELLAWQTERLLSLETARRGIVVEARPELVVEIELDGVQASTRYPGGVALRFARVKRYREDKSPQEADTIDAVRALLP